MEVSSIAAIKSFIAQKVADLTCADYQTPHDKMGDGGMLLPDLGQPSARDSNRSHFEN